MQAGKCDMGQGTNLALIIYSKVKPVGTTGQ